MKKIKLAIFFILIDIKSLLLFCYLIESLIGKISFSSRFPQYLMTAILTGAVQVTRLRSDIFPALN